MAAVQEAEFHEFVWGDVGDELGADLFPGGAAAPLSGGEAVLDHPLGEGFGEDRPGVVDTFGVA